jgi:histidinol-phosphate/aromatic aminotransferase/cobyric acid decarboxylase-like protein
LYEVRLLTVLKDHRGSRVAALLMYGAFRWIESHGGTQITAIGRHEILSVYLKAGLVDCGKTVQSGAVQYHLLHGEVGKLRSSIDAGSWPVEAMEKSVRWKLGIPLRKPAGCFHGGAFFDSIGPRFDQLEKAKEIINADVLDAWFPPAPSVVQTLQENLPWLLRTSPPTGCEGLLQCIAEARGVQLENILAGAGSSDLIFLALPHWLNRNSRVLLLDPTYGEYAHVLEKVIGCRVDRFSLRRELGYEISLEAMELAMGQPYDMIILVNPNSPTGRHIPLETMARLMKSVGSSTRVWIDETYVDFVDPSQSMERMAAQSENLIVCKSMSKAYALSGARVAYLCAGAHQLEALRAHTPPWAVSLLGQVAAVRALASPDYYMDRWRETAMLRQNLAADLTRLGWEVIPGVANFLLCHLPSNGPRAAELVDQCRAKGLFLRDAARMGANLGNDAVRLAVKDAATNQRMLTILEGIFPQS